MRYTLLAAFSLAVFGGCASMPSTESWKIPNPLAKEEEKKDPYPTPVKLASTWAPDVLSAPNKTSTRGFGGRLFFYDEKSRAVPVDGELQVIAYLDTGIVGAPPITRQFAFTPEQLTSHFSQSDLGASYSIWIPWDANGGLQHTITLVPQFQPEEGPVVKGAPTTVVLPGPTTLAKAQQQQTGRRSQPIYTPGQDQLSPQLRQTSYSSNGQGVSLPRRSGVTTTTIPMGRSLGR